jgi:hypothetical protein
LLQGEMRGRDRKRAHSKQHRPDLGTPEHRLSPPATTSRSLMPRPSMLMPRPQPTGGQPRLSGARQSRIRGPSMFDDAKKGVPPASPTPADRLRQEMTTFNARRQMVPLLQPGILLEDVRERLSTAMGAGSAVGSEIAGQLHRLRDLQLTREESLAVIRAAANHVVERYVAARERGGKLTKEQLDSIDVPDVPAKTFAREFAVALGNQVKWKAEAIERQREPSSSVRSARHGSWKGGVLSARDKELADLRAKSSWTVTGTTASHADLVSLAEEFPTIDVNRLRRMLVDQFAERGVVRESGSFLGGAGRTHRIPVVLSEVVDAIRRDLLLEIYGPSPSQITGPVASDERGEIVGTWFVISQIWFHGVLAELPALSKSDIRSAFADISWEIRGAGDGDKAGPPSGLTWRRYGRGLQADVEVALKARLVMLTGEKAKKSAEQATRMREAERAKEEASRKCQLPFRCAPLSHQPTAGRHLQHQETTDEHHEARPLENLPSARPSAMGAALSRRPSRPTAAPDRDGD